MEEGVARALEGLPPLTGLSQYSQTQWGDIRADTLQEPRPAEAAAARHAEAELYPPHRLVRLPLPLSAIGKFHSIVSGQRDVLDFNLKDLSSVFPEGAIRFYTGAGTRHPQYGYMR